MAGEIDEATIEYLLARAGLAPSEAEKAELRAVHAGIRAMAERVRRPRGIMAEPASIYDFADGDLR
jgi:hypothetical protein